MGLGFAHSGWDIHVKHHDVFLRLAEYTFEIPLRLTGKLIGRSVRPLTGLRVMDDEPGDDADSSGRKTSYYELLHGTAFSPDSIENPKPIKGDRPYSFLLGFTVMRTTLRADEEAAWTSELTVGTIGSQLGKHVQTGIHRVLHLNLPEGWANQLHNTNATVLGVLAMRYGLSYESILFDARWKANSGATNAIGPKWFEVTWSAGTEVGYYTSANAGTRLRLGRFYSPFWAQRNTPLGVGARDPGSGDHNWDWYVFAGARARYTASNALLSGYGAHAGPVRVTGRQLVHESAEWDAGFSVVWYKSETRSYQVTYAADAGRTREFRTDFSRDHRWGGLYFTIGR